MMIRLRTLFPAVVILAALFLACNCASAQKGAKGAGGASSAAAAPSGSSGGAASSAPIEVQMLSFGALDEILDKVAEQVCALNPGKVIVLDAPSLLALQNFDAFYANAEALQAAFSDMTPGGGAGGGIDDFADITSAVSAAAAASTSETSSSFTITDPTPALMFLNHLGRQHQANKPCTNAHYAGVYGADETQNLFFPPTIGKDGETVHPSLRPVLSELSELSKARRSALLWLMTPASSITPIDSQPQAPANTNTNPAQPATPAPATHTGISVDRANIPVLRRLSFSPQDGQQHPPQPPTTPTGPPNAGSNNQPSQVTTNPTGNGTGTAQGNGPPTVKETPDDSKAQDPRVAAFTGLDTTYNAFLSGLSAPSATTGQPLLSSILQGFRIRSLMACVQDRSDPNVTDKYTCPSNDNPVIGVYINVASAGGTQQDRKNLITAVITGDWIRYSGGVSVNVVVFQIGGTKQGILFADLLRYRTPLKTIKKPGGYNEAGSYGDNLGDVLIQKP
ncbi:MAG TPA: hypothetical protein VME23_06540 [Terracidiphilus sp.]|nr:hypothetical protein [Terracidiphilus sp.]